MTKLTSILALPECQTALVEFVKTFCHMIKNSPTALLTDGTGMVMFKGYPHGLFRADDIQKCLPTFKTFTDMLSVNLAEFQLPGSRAAPDIAMDKATFMIAEIISDWSATALAHKDIRDKQVLRIHALRAELSAVTEYMAKQYGA